MQGRKDAEKEAGKQAHRGGCGAPVCPGAALRAAAAAGRRAPELSSAASC